MTPIPIPPAQAAAGRDSGSATSAPNGSAGGPLVSLPARSVARRILAVSHTWQGATDYGFVRAFRRAGHSVQVMSDAEFFPIGWQQARLKVARRLLAPLLVKEYQAALVAAARALRPQLFF